MSCGWRSSKTWPWFVFVSLKSLGLFSEKDFETLLDNTYLNVHMLFEGILIWFLNLKNKFTRDEVIVDLASSNLYTNLTNIKKGNNYYDLVRVSIVLLWFSFSISPCLASIEKIISNTLEHTLKCSNCGLKQSPKFDRLLHPHQVSPHRNLKLWDKHAVRLGLTSVALLCLVYFPSLRRVALGKNAGFFPKQRLVMEPTVKYADLQQKITSCLCFNLCCSCMELAQWTIPYVLAFLLPLFTYEIWSGTTLQVSLYLEIKSLFSPTKNTSTRHITRIRKIIKQEILNYM